MKKGDTILSVLQEIRDMLKQEKKSPVVASSAPRQITDRFMDNNDGTIFDKQLNLLWVKDPTAIGEAFKKTMTFEEAKSSCENLSYAGYNSGWRMPTVEELRSIVDYTRHDPAWNIDAFGGKHDDWYWSSTPCAWNKDAAWCVGSFYGSMDDIGRCDRYYVRPVRSSQ